MGYDGKVVEEETVDDNDEETDLFGSGQVTDHTRDHFLMRANSHHKLPACACVWLPVLSCVLICIHPAGVAFIPLVLVLVDHNSLHHTDGL